MEAISKLLVDIHNVGLDPMERRAYRKKIHIRVDDDLHKRLRMKVADEGVTIQTYLTNLIERDLR
jgi:predicted DNA binding CopG/RHH family protein